MTHCSPSESCRNQSNCTQIEPGLWHLHRIDKFSRFSNASSIKNKNDSIKMFIKYWIGISVVTFCVISDNEGKFVSNTFYKICEKFNTRIFPTPS